MYSFRQNTPTPNRLQRPLKRVGFMPELPTGGPLFFGQKTMDQQRAGVTPTNKGTSDHRSLGLVYCDVYTATECKMSGHLKTPLAYRGPQGRLVPPCKSKGHSPDFPLKFDGPSPLIIIRAFVPAMITDSRIDKNTLIQDRLDWFLRECPEKNSRVEIVQKKRMILKIIAESIIRKPRAGEVWKLRQDFENDATLKNEKKRCLLCRRPGIQHRHHIVPLECGGDNRPENIIPICFYCHSVIHNLSLPIPKGVFYDQINALRPA